MLCFPARIAASNELAEVPDELWSLPSLTVLSLAANRLEALSDCMNATALVNLDLEGNSLRHLPVSLGNLTSLKVASHTQSFPLRCLS